MKDGKKTCERCNDDEWPCFFVDGLCRMCQARRRDVQRDVRRGQFPAPVESAQ